MATGHLSIDLNAIASNWAALNALSAPEVTTAAVVKADAYGLGLGPIASALANAGARDFCVAVVEEGAALRQVLGPDHPIHVFGGYMEGDAPLIRSENLMPLLNSPEQVTRFAADFPGHPAGVQLDSGMNRLGIEPADIAPIRSLLDQIAPRLLISHLACADDPSHLQNTVQRDVFAALTLEFPGIPASLAATGGVILGQDFHFNMTRPGIGVYGGLPFQNARPVVHLSLPVIQTRDVAIGEAVGYGAQWRAERPSRIATVSAGYADGIFRGLGGKLSLFAEDVRCPVVGRVSMDLLTVDVTDLATVPPNLDLLSEQQSVDALADTAGTIGYEVLTSLGSRYNRRYIGI